MQETMKLLIGYDGSQYAGVALDDLRRAGLPRAAEAIILTVSELWLPYVRTDSAAQSPSAGSSEPGGSQGTSAEPITDAHVLGLEAKKRLHTHFPEWVIKAEESSGSPAREILRKAAEWEPDLITVGSQGRSGLGRFLLGSVSQKVVNEAHCSVRVARESSGKKASPVRILIGLDGAPASEAAVQVVSTRMWPPASEVRLITVVDPSVAGAAQRVGTSSNAVSRAWAEKFLDAAAKKLGAVNLAVSTMIDEGDPKNLIIANSVEWGAECIFIGASGTREPLKEFLLGSVATAVVSRAQCSVEVVRSSS